VVPAAGKGADLLPTPPLPMMMMMVVVVVTNWTRREVVIL
jgi:hypothetical protein